MLPFPREHGTLWEIAAAPKGLRHHKDGISGSPAIPRGSLPGEGKERVKFSLLLCELSPCRCHQGGSPREAPPVPHRQPQTKGPLLSHGKPTRSCRSSRSSSTSWFSRLILAKPLPRCPLPGGSPPRAPAPEAERRAAPSRHRSPSRSCPKPAGTAAPGEAAPPSSQPSRGCRSGRTGPGAEGGTRRARNRVL
ncbi:translation initiation factor IF-2-like [Cuculus canorus]|uniref:translation initiation factor IF-2-like n=1 Tax=Cuculus canorus TaxID=55661 RepID=UPI0023AA7CF3|nr:translation initiation factor IF-2-like [Cuculus canorus]